jgi:hypothetical protein
MTNTEQREANRKQNGMTREQAIACYRRVKEWEQSVSNQLRESILVPHFSGNMCCLHNWMIDYEQGGRDWGQGRKTIITKEVYKLGRYYNWKQNHIWQIAERLGNHFASMF